MRKHLEKVMGLAYALLFVACLVLIFGGIELIYSGPAEGAAIELLGFQLKSVIVGRICIGLGVLGLVAVARAPIHYMQDMLRSRSGPHD